MRKQFTKAFALILMGVFATTMAFAQGAGGHDHSRTEPDPLKGDGWEVFHFPLFDNSGNFLDEFESIHYYNGGQFDDLTVEKFLGHHWSGHTLDELKPNEEFFLCNMATGEYLQIGDYWGTNEMTNHAGISYQIVPGYSIRKKQGWVKWQNDPQGYWLCPKLPGEEGGDDMEKDRAVGRPSVSNGVAGNFEHNRYFVLRNRDEYHDGLLLDQSTNTITNYNDGADGADPGGFLFYFHPVIKNGKKAYIIYTHRRTNSTAGAGTFQDKSEYGNRESYLLVYSAGKERTGYNAVLFKKFAGQMYDPDNVNSNYLQTPKGEEIDFYNAGVPEVTIDDALNNTNSDYYVCNDENNLWKIVTKAERDRFRLVASEDKPVDMTYRIYNPKFYTSYTYVWRENQCSNDGGHYTHANDQTAYHWQWFDDDRDTHLNSDHHVHPYDIAYDDTRNSEYHKIGTGHFYRYWATGAGSVAVRERTMTTGNEANYVGSIWKGSANLQQEIGTLANPLREGLYVVCVKGFFAPHDMMKYVKDGENYMRDTYNTTSPIPTNWAWYNEAVVGGTGKDAGKWRRSHDSYLFAWSKPDGDNAEEVRRMLPSIYEGAINLEALNVNEKKKLSKSDFLNSDDFNKYTQLGYYSNLDNPEEVHLTRRNLLTDETNFAQYDGAYFSNSSQIANTPGTTWSVPKTLMAAGRWFNAAEGVEETSSESFKNLQNYRIALPVYVGPGGELTIGVDHTKLPREETYVGRVYRGKNPETGEDVWEDNVEIKIPASGEDEWVCFDDFELIYLGKVEPDEFVLDERHGSDKNMVPSRLLTDGATGEPYTEGENLGKWSNGGKDTSIPNKNNTQWKDIFSDTDLKLKGDLDATTVKTMVIRRTLMKNGWGSIVFPVSLTYGQLKEGFGEEVQISRLDDFNGRIIQYKAVQLDDAGNPKSDGSKIVEAGVPYIIRPTIDPVIPAPTGSSSDLKYERPKFTKAYSTSAIDIAGYYLRDYDRNYEVETEMEGPIYVIPQVTITCSETFPQIKIEDYQVEEGGVMVTKQRRNRNFSEEVLAKQDSTWTTITPFDSRNLSPAKYYKINRSDAPGRYYMKETAVYHAGEKIPAYSYYWAAGKMYYTREELPTTRGLFSYLQLIREDDGSAEAGKAYSKPFINGSDSFIEVLGETNGIEDVNAPEPDGKIEIYDLMGRKVSNPRPGTIYIMNGVKVMWK